MSPESGFGFPCWHPLKSCCVCPLSSHSHISTWPIDHYNAATCIIQLDPTNEETLNRTHWQTRTRARAHTHSCSHKHFILHKAEGRPVTVLILSERLWQSLEQTLAQPSALNKLALLLNVAWSEAQSLSSNSSRNIRHCSKYTSHIFKPYASHADVPSSRPSAPLLFFNLHSCLPRHLCRQLRRSVYSIHSHSSRCKNPQRKTAAGHSACHIHQGSQTFPGHGPRKLDEHLAGVTLR